MHREENRRSRRQSSFGIRDYNLYRGSSKLAGLCRRLQSTQRPDRLLWGAAVTRAGRWSSVKRFSLWMPETERHCSVKGYENLTRRNSGFRPDHTAPLYPSAFFYFRLVSFSLSSLTLCPVHPVLLSPSRTPWSFWLINSAEYSVSLDIIILGRRSRIMVRNDNKDKWTYER